MLTSRGQENLIHARPINGKALQPKTPSNLQTPRTTNRAPLGAKTTNAKAHTVLKDQKNAKFQVFKTPAPAQHNIRPDRTIKQPSASRTSGKSKLTANTLERVPVHVIDNDIEDEEPDFGYAPPPPVELPDPPMEFGYDQTFPQFLPENICRGYGEIYLSSPKDENGFSIRMKKEEEEYRQNLDRQAQEYTKKVDELLSKPYVISNEEPDLPKKRFLESKPDTVRAKSAASALSSIRVPSCANKQTASSRMKINTPVVMKASSAQAPRNNRPTARRPLVVSKNTIGFPKAKKPASIIPQQSSVSSNDIDDLIHLADDLSDFEFFSPEIDNGEDLFQLPVPE